MANTTPPTRIPSPVLRNLAAVTVVPLALLSACSKDAPESRVASLDKDAGANVEDDRQSRADDDPDVAMRAYTRCMREQGVDLPDLDQSGGNSNQAPVDIDIDMEKLDAASKKCAPLLPPTAANDDTTAGDLDAMVQFAKCMRDKGIDMPDPQVIDGSAVGSTIDADDPKTAAAAKECEKTGSSK